MGGRHYELFTTNYFGGDPYLKVFDIATNEVLLDSDTQDGPVSFSPDGRYLVSGSLVLAGTVIYDTATWQPVARHYGNGVDIAWSPDGQRYAMASSTTVTIWALPLVVGRQAAVHVVQGDTLNVREGVGLDFAILEKLPEGAVVTVLEGPREAGGNIWWRVQTAGGTEGWVVAEADDIQTLVP
jgi:WD40 repeat protein